MKILFWLRKARLSKAGLAPVICRITANGTTHEFQTRARVLPAKWCNDSKREKDKASKANILLNAIQNDLETTWLHLEVNKMQANATRIYQITFENYYKAKLLSVCFEEYYGFLVSLEGTPEAYSEGTLRNWRVRKKNLGIYLSDTKNENLLLNEIKPKHADDIYYFFLKQGKAQNYVIRLVESLKTVLDYAVRQEYILINPFASVKLTRAQEPEPVSLTSLELEKIKTARLGSEKLEKARDIFVFCCYTGLSHIDYTALTSKNLATGIDGKTWLYIQRSKGKGKKQYGKVAQPLHHEVKKLTEQYGGIDQLPHMSKEKVSDYMKIVASALGIKKNVSTKIARRTFAYLALNVWNVPEETVAALMGHADTRMLKHYTNISEEKIANDMKGL